MNVLEVLLKTVADCSPSLYGVLGGWLICRSFFRSHDTEIEVIGYLIILLTVAVMIAQKAVKP